MRLCESLAINLKYFRLKYHLSQEKFAEILGTTLSYLNQIEIVRWMLSVQLLISLLVT